MGQKEILPSDLQSFVETEITSTIYCETCGNESVRQMIGHTACREFYNEGWRLINDQPVCPNCRMEIESTFQLPNQNL